VSRKFIVMVPVSLTLLMTSCSDSKVVQCQRLIKQVNEGIELIEKDKGSQVITSGKLAKELEDVTQKMRELNVKDPKLKDYQNNFVKVFESLSQNIAKASKALASAKTAQASVEGRNTIQKAREEIDTSLKKASDIAKQSDSAASELKKYCSQAK
jgi:chromosome segregation ATPase